MTEHREVAVEVTVAAPIEVVWRALRDRAEIRRWHGWDYDQLEAEIDLMYFSAAKESAADRRLDTGHGVFELEDQGATTLVRVVMAAPPDDPTWQGYYDDIRQGWLTFAEQLRFALERHRGQDRSTVYLAGVRRDESQPPLLELLGLGPAAHLAPGQRYAVTAAVGEDLAGEVWFRAEHQLGLTVDGWGDGLLVVSDSWTPPGASGAIISTYERDDTALRERWEGWWRRHFREAEVPQPADVTP